MKDDPVDELQVRSWNSDAVTEKYVKGLVGNLQRASYHMSTDRQTLASRARKVGGSRYLIIEINFDFFRLGSCKYDMF